MEDIKAAVNKLIGSVIKSCKKYNIKGKTINLKYRFKDFTTHTRSRTLGGYTNDIEIVKDLLHEMVKELEYTDQPIRLLGAGLSSLNTERKDNQLEFNFEKKINQLQLLAVPNVARSIKFHLWADLQIYNCFPCY